MKKILFLLTLISIIFLTVNNTKVNAFTFEIPTPPTKPEPPLPPFPCTDTPTPTPVLTPTPTANPNTPTPTPTSTSTDNPTTLPTPISISCGNDEHLDASGTHCVRWELGGAPQNQNNTSSTTSVLGTSTSILAATDSTIAADRFTSTLLVEDGPTNIVIPSLHLDLGIAPAIVEGNNWQFFAGKVSWLATSSSPKQGNTILYAHNLSGLFGKLTNLKIGDEIKVFNNTWFTFKVKSLQKVSAANINSILTDKVRLTLFTCNGAFDQQRLVVYAE